MGISTPGGDEADDFIVPGGQPAPEHLTVDDLSFVGHLLGNPLSALNTFEIFTDEGREIDNEMTVATNGAKRQILASIEFLLSRYAADIDAIPGLRGFLTDFRNEVKLYHWRGATQLFREAKDRFKF